MPRHIIAGDPPFGHMVISELGQELAVFTDLSDAEAFASLPADHAARTMELDEAVEGGSDTAWSAAAIREAGRLKKWLEVLKDEPDPKIVLVLQEMQQRLETCMEEDGDDG